MDDVEQAGEVNWRNNVLRK